MAFCIDPSRKPTVTVLLSHFHQVIPSSPAPVRHFSLQMLDSAIKRGFLLPRNTLSLTFRFGQDIAALEQTKAVLMSFLDPETANNPALDLKAEPQCNLTSYTSDF